VSLLAERVVAIHRSLAEAGVPHAFGGALALAFHTQHPRGTVDIDVNLFVAGDQAEVGFDALPEGVTWDGDDVERVRRDGQVRVFWDRTPLDLFFSTHEFHRHASRRALVVPFAGAHLPILSALDLAVFKAFFSRTKDWADLEAMAEAGTVDGPAVTGWLTELLGPDDHRVERMRAVLAAAAALVAHPGPDAEPRFAPPG
jgi:hypothetical protein